MTVRLHVVVSGRVQGVGYRQTTCGEAGRQHLVGWVRNLPDGRVEAVFEGIRDELEEMLSWCSHGPAFADVVKIDVAWEEASGKFTEFEILF